MITKQELNDVLKDYWQQEQMRDGILMTLLGLMVIIGIVILFLVVRLQRRLPRSTL